MDIMHDCTLFFKETPCLYISQIKYHSLSPNQISRHHENSTLEIESSTVANLLAFFNNRKAKFAYLRHLLNIENMQIFEEIGLFFGGFQRM